MQNVQNVIPVKVVKEFRFEAAHSLEKYVGACNNLHGHSYKLQVGVEGIPDEETGIVVDFKDLKNIVQKHIVDIVDHSDLNESMKYFNLQGNTSCENMIVAFWYELDEVLSETTNEVLVELRLWETENSYSTLTREMVYKGEERWNELTK